MTAPKAIRRYRRFKGWDYAKGASLFITISTEPRRPLFGRVVGGRVALSPLGAKVAEALRAMPLLNPGIMLFGWVVMPDHIHFNCAIAPGLAEPLKVLGRAIRRFKNHTTKLAKLSLAIRAEEVIACQTAGGSDVSASCPDGLASSPDGRTVFGLSSSTLWQQGYHDYLLVSGQMIDATERYIAYNPLKWELMHGIGSLRIKEPLSSPRLDLGDYWKGVGNAALLSPDEKLVSLRVSREVSTPGAVAAVVKRMENAVANGYIIISGFISPGERAVCEMLRRRKDARFVRILPSSIPNAGYKPESAYLEPLAEGRYLEMARGNDETEFDRRACLDLNDEIIKIAAAGEGLAIYWKTDGPHIVAKGISSAGRKPSPCNDPDGMTASPYGLQSRPDGRTVFGRESRK